MVILYITNIDAIKYKSIKTKEGTSIYKNEDVLITNYEISDSISKTFSEWEIRTAIISGSYQTSEEYLDYNTWWSKKQITKITKELKRENNTVKIITHPPVKSEWEINWVVFLFWIVLSTGAYILGKNFKKKHLPIWQKILTVIEGSCLSIGIGGLLNIMIERGTIWSTFGYALLILIGMAVLIALNKYEGGNEIQEGDKRNQFHLISIIVLIIGSIFTALTIIGVNHNDPTPYTIAGYCIIVPMLVGYIKKKSK